VDRILEGLKVKPIAASVSSSPGPLDHGIVDFGIVKNLLFRYLYIPYGNASTVAVVLAALEQGDATPLWEVLEATNMVAECSAGNDRAREQLIVESQNAIQCSDGAPVNDTLEKLQQWFDGIARKSSFAQVLPIRIQCA
jgi:hypothetical protein